MRDALAILKKYETWAIEKYHEVCSEIGLHIEKMEGAGVYHD